MTATKVLFTAALLGLVALVGTPAQEPLTVYPNGSVGIGTTAQPTERLQVDGNVKAMGRYKDATGVVMPVGSILPYGGTTAPEGWLMCNGAPVSRESYPDLFAAVGTSFGAGDGSTTFNIPDLRGRFLRGVDGAAGRDPDGASRTAMATGGATGDNVGSVQGDAIRNITGTFGGYRVGSVGSTATGAFTFTNPGGQGASGSGEGALFHFNPSLVVPTGGDNRPVNANVNFIIKY